MSLGKSKMLSQGASGVVNTDNFDIVTYTGAGGTYPIGSGIDASVTINSGSANYALGSTSYGNNSGKHYFEVEYVTAGSSGTPTLMVGIINSAYQESWTNAQTKMYYANNGNKYTGGSGASYGATFDEGDVIGVAYDGTARTVTFYKNNVSQGTAFTGLVTGFPNYKPAIGTGLNSETAQFRFTTADFTYTPPTGYSEWGSSTVSAHSGTVNSARAAHPINFQPDFVWLKDRDASYSFQLYDSVRGSTEKLHCNQQSAESTDSTGLTSFDSNGFTVSTNVGINTNNNDYVGWCWKGGGAAVSNTDGSNTSVTVSANVDAGFSIIKWTGNGSYGTNSIGHGLGVRPEFIICKNLSASSPWIIYYGEAAYYLDFSLGAGNGGSVWNNQRPNSTTFNAFRNVPSLNEPSNDYIAYAFTNVPGYQDFGIYNGSSSSDVVINVGFRPRFLVIKCVSTGSTTWTVHDSTRYPTTNNENGQSGRLRFSYNSTETVYTNTPVFFTDTGFTIDSSVTGTSFPEYTLNNRQYFYWAIA